MMNWKIWSEFDCFHFRFGQVILLRIQSSSRKIQVRSQSLAHDVFFNDFAIIQILKHATELKILRKIEII